ncbi:hypothetical protein, partial [Glaesserella parasuis]|uniref:hypothetical protein n=1 Tax=Glaesserella parasuis TaxID=738 RepID=UPI003F49BB35
MQCRTSTDRGTEACHYTDGMADGITTADAALWLGVTPEAIYKWRERGLVTPLNPDHKPLRWDPD